MGAAWNAGMAMSSSAGLMWAAAAGAGAGARRSSSTEDSSSSQQQQQRQQPQPKPKPRRDYAALFARGKDGAGCPPLFLAPMEGLGDRRLRRALAFSSGGFDEACREFTRVPGVLSQGAKPERLLRGIALNGYDAHELMSPSTSTSTGTLLAAQVMGSNVELLERCARYLAEEGGAPRVDLNCGCPANVVTGKGAGSSLLRDPRDVEACVAAVARGVAGTGCAVSLKLRSGYDDRELLRDNLLAAQAGGAQFITLHPRTRAQGYSGRAQWADIALAVDVLDIPVIGNGDVTSPKRATELLFETGCAGIMIGRGAVQDPLIFRRIAAALGYGGGRGGGGNIGEGGSSAAAGAKGDTGTSSSASSSFGGERGEDVSASASVRSGGLWGLSREEEAREVVLFLRRFADEVFNDAEERLSMARQRQRRQRPEDMENFKLGKLKQICKYLFASNQSLSRHITRVLGTRLEDATPRALLDEIEELVMQEWNTPEDVLVDAFSMRTRYADGVGKKEKAGRIADKGVGKDIVRM